MLVLPAEYARRHVDLGYALTVHRAQGITVETAHLVTTAAMTREALYVGLTRGRRANHAYTATDTPPAGDAHPTPAPAGPADGDDATPGREILQGILAATGTEPAATTALRTAAREAVSPDRLRPVAATLTADITRRRWTRLLTQRLSDNVDHAVVRDLTHGPGAGALHAALARAETAGQTPTEILDHVSSAIVNQAQHAPGRDAGAESGWAGDRRAPSRSTSGGSPGPWTTGPTPSPRPGRSTPATRCGTGRSPTPVIPPPRSWTTSTGSWTLGSPRPSTGAPSRTCPTTTPTTDPLSLATDDPTPAALVEGPAL